LETKPSRRAGMSASAELVPARAKMLIFGHWHTE